MDETAESTGARRTRVPSLAAVNVTIALFGLPAVAAVFTAVYLRRRTPVPVVGAHALVWALSALGQVYG